MRGTQLSEEKQKVFNALLADYVFGQTGDFSISDFAKDPRIAENKDFRGLSKRELLTGLDVSCLVFSRDNQVFTPRQRYFADARFIISPTEDEIDGGVLIPGHRFLPFCTAATFPWDCTLTPPEGKALTKKKITRSFDSLQIFYTLFGWENAGDLLVSDQEENQRLLTASDFAGDTKVTISVYDCSKLYKQWNFKAGDGILCRVDDWASGFYSITHLPGEERQKSADRSADWGKAMEKGFRQTFDRFKMGIPIEEQIAYGYYYAGSGVLKDPPIHLGGLVDASPRIHFVAFGMESHLWYEEELSFSGLGLDKPKGRKDAPGSFNRVLESLGVTFTETEVEAYIRDALFKRRGNHGVGDGIEKAVLERLFPEGEPLFSSQRQAREFEGCFTKLLDRVTRSYNYFTDQKTGKIRSDILVITDIHYAWISRLGKEEDQTSPENLPVQIFAGIVQVMSFLSGFLEQLNRGGTVGENEVDQFIRYLPEVKKSLEDLMGEVEFALKNKSPKKGKAGSGNLRIISPGDRDTGDTGGGETLQHVFVLRVSLKDISPPIWRSVQVPGSVTLGDLHRIIQIVMGWSDSHLHSFEIDGLSYSSNNSDFYSDMDNEDEDEDDYTLEDLDLRVKQKFLYTYDFGDSWDHQILVSRILSPGEDSAGDYRQPRCLSGRRACPPEDCGGFPGYEDILEALREPRKKKNRELLEWVGDYDPEDFDVDMVNEVLLNSWKDDPDAD
ncbi:MAG: plasmid pRiA4b ORF-3 family protein [Spirochaetaceae bacterium]|nr:plasmid pRiA4b ORF-3 family protein [Spirochaetaceae bacterium]